MPVITRRQIEHIMPWFILTALGMVAVFKFFDLALTAPHGPWDAWAIWNVRARFLYRVGLDKAFAPSMLDTTFSPMLSHSEYPPLLPILVSVGWKLTYTENQAIPLALMFGFMIGTAGVLYQALRSLSTMLLAWLLTTFLLINSNFIYWSAAQYADIPLGFFVLSATVCLTMFEHDQHMLYLWLAGTLSGLALLTKNESVLFAVAVAVVYAHLWREPRTARWFAAGILPFALALIAFKVAVSTPNDLVSGQGSATIDRLLDVSRYRVIGQAVRGKLAWYAQASGLIVAFRLAHGDIKHIRIPKALYLVAIILLGYLVIYVITPHPLQWHLETSLSRLVLHIWPTALFGYGLLFQARPYEQQSEHYGIIDTTR